MFHRFRGAAGAYICTLTFGWRSALRPAWKTTRYLGMALTILNNLTYMYRSRRAEERMGRPRRRRRRRIQRRAESRSAAMASSKMKATS